MFQFFCFFQQLFRLNSSQLQKPGYPLMPLQQGFPLFPAFLCQLYISI